MNPRIVTAAIGVLTTILGIGGLISPQLVMERVVGFAVDPSFSENFVHGEVRAVYGGMFTMLGIATVWAAVDLATHRGLVFWIGLLWLGLCGGRLVSVAVDGPAGLWGWMSAAFELTIGGLLVASSMMGGRSSAPVASSSA